MFTVIREETVVLSMSSILKLNQHHEKLRCFSGCRLKLTYTYMPLSFCFISIVYCYNFEVGIQHNVD